MKKQILLTISTAAVISASICAIPNVFGQVYNTYSDPNGKFGIGYPSDWSTQNFTHGSIFGPRDASGQIILFYTEPPPASKEDLATVLDAIVSQLNQSNAGASSSAVLTQPIDCNTYTIAGHSACSVKLEQITYESCQICVPFNNTWMILASNISGTIYTFEARETPENFNLILPTFFHMLSSFKPGSH